MGIGVGVDVLACSFSKKPISAIIDVYILFVESRIWIGLD